MIGKPPSPAPAVQLDWRAYFEEFSEIHGRNPIVHGGRLLFPDGWMYSMNDYRGPEYPPPEEERTHRALVRTYWLRRRAIISSELEDVNRLIEALEVEQDVRSAPLQQVVRYYDRDTRTYKTRRGPASEGLEGLKHRLEWLTADLAVCASHLGDADADADTA